MYLSYVSSATANTSIAEFNYEKIGLNYLNDPHDLLES